MGLPEQEAFRNDLHRMEQELDWKRSPTVSSAATQEFDALRALLLRLVRGLRLLTEENIAMAKASQDSENIR
jgi:hypothetical protein